MKRKIALDDCIEVGYVHKTHGLGGDVLVKFQQLYAPTFEEFDQYFILIDGALVPYFVEDNRVKFRSTETANVKFRWIDSQEQAKELVAKKIFVFEDEALIDEEVFDGDSMVGYTVIDEKEGTIGAIEEVNDFSGNIVLTVDYDGNEVMIPLAEGILIEILHDDEEVHVQAPDGIFDI